MATWIGAKPVSGNKGWGCTSYIKKAFTRRFVLGIPESRKFNIPVKNMATGRCPWDVYMCFSCFLCFTYCFSIMCAMKDKSQIVHISVGMRVARSIGMGNARASVRGTGNSEVSTLFSYIMACAFSFQSLTLSVRKHRC